MDKLISKIEKEWLEYQSDILDMTKNEIFDKSYETAIKYELSELIGELSKLNSTQTEMLLEQENPLDYLYQRYIDDDALNICNELRIVFENLQPIKE